MLPFLLWCVGGRQGRNDDDEEMLPKCSALHEHETDGEGGEEGREERSWMDAWIPKLSGEKADQEAEVGTTSMQKRKVKRNHDWSSCCSSPLPLGRQSQGCSHLPLPSPEGCSPRTASELQERRDESPGLQGNPSPQRTRAGL